MLVDHYIIMVFSWILNRPVILTASLEPTILILSLVMLLTWP